MSNLLRLLRELLVGEDWRLALGVVAALGATALLAAAGLPAWWPGPLLVAATLLLAVRRE